MFGSVHPGAKLPALRELGCFASFGCGRASAGRCRGAAAGGRTGRPVGLLRVRAAVRSGRAGGDGGPRAPVVGGGRHRARPVRRHLPRPLPRPAAARACATERRCRQRQELPDPSGDPRRSRSLPPRPGQTSWGTVLSSTSRSAPRRSSISPRSSRRCWRGSPARRSRSIVTVSELNDPEALGELPATVHAERWLPLAPLLSRCDAVLCHAGTGTTLAALTAGLPLDPRPARRRPVRQRPCLRARGRRARADARPGHRDRGRR